MSKEPKPLPKPGDPQYRDPTKPHPSSPPPPRKVDSLTEQNMVLRIKLEAALAKIELQQRQLDRLELIVNRLDKEVYLLSTKIP